MEKITLPDWTVIEFSREKKQITRSNITIFFNWETINDWPIICDTDSNEDHEEKLKSIIEQVARMMIPSVNESLSEYESSQLTNSVDNDESSSQE